MTKQKACSLLIGMGFLVSSGCSPIDTGVCICCALMTSCGGAEQGRLGDWFPGHCQCGAGDGSSGEGGCLLLKASLEFVVTGPFVPFHNLKSNRFHFHTSEILFGLIGNIWNCLLRPSFATVHFFSAVVNRRHTEAWNTDEPKRGCGLKLPNQWTLQLDLLWVC